MNLTHALTILIQGNYLAGDSMKEGVSDVEKLGEAASDATGDLEELGDVGPNVFDVLAAGVKKALNWALKLTAAITAITTVFVGAAVGASRYAAELEAAHRVFQGIVREDAPEMLAALQKNSSFMLEDLRLLQTYNEGYLLTGDIIARRMPEAYRYMSKVALGTGDDIDFLMERLYRSVGRLSTRWMAYVGTVVELKEATAAAVDMFGKQEDALTRQEIQIAMFDRVMQKLAERTAQMPDLLMTTEQLFRANTAAVRNLWGEFGMHFTPVAREVLEVTWRLTTTLDELISKGGPFYNFFRTIAATAVIVGEEINSLLDQLLGMKDVIYPELENMANTIMSYSWKAFEWGANIITQLAVGMIKAASNALAAAINFISGMLAFWFAPGSPPRVAPDIDKWGASTLEEWLKGFTEGSFDVLEGIQAPLQDVLGALVGAGFIEEKEGIEKFLDTTYDLISGLNLWRNTGERSALLFEQLSSVAGGFGEHLVELVRRQLDLAEAEDRLRRATKELTAAEKEQEAALKGLNKATDEYYMALLNRADYAELKVLQSSRASARRRYDQSKENLKAAELEKEAAEEGMEGLKERLDLQNRLVDQLVLLTQKAAELNKVEEDSARKSKEPKKGGAGDLPFQLPQIEKMLPEGASVDKAFEDLKEQIRDKFRSLWADLVTIWEESGVGKAINNLRESLGNLKAWLDENGPDVRQKLSDLLTPVWEWVQENIFQWAVDEWDKWKIWWEQDGPVITNAAKLVLQAIKDIPETMAEWAENPPQGFWDWIRYQVARTYIWIESMLVSIVTLVPRMVATIHTTFAILTEHMLANIRSLITAGAKALTGDMHGAETELAKIIARIPRRFDEISKMWGRFIDEDMTQGVAGQWLTKLKTKLKKMEPLFTKGGSDVGDRFGSGLNSKAMYVQRAYDNTLRAPLEVFKDYWSDDAWPTISGVLDSVWRNDIKPTFEDLRTKLKVDLTTAQTDFSELWSGDEVGWPAIVSALANAWDSGEGSMLWIFEQILEMFNLTLQRALSDFYWYWIKKFEIINAGPGSVLMTLDKIERQLQNLKRWADENTIKIRMEVGGDPAAIPHSPMPLYTAWKEFSNEFDGRTIRPRVDPSSLGLGTSTAPVSNNGGYIYIEKIELLAEDYDHGRDLIADLKEASL